MDSTTLMNLLASNVSSVNNNVKTLNDSLTPAVNQLVDVINVLVASNRELDTRMSNLEALLAASQTRSRVKAPTTESTEAPAHKVTKKALFKNFNLWVRDSLTADMANLQNNCGQQTTVFSDCLEKARLEVKVPKGVDANTYVGSVPYNNVLAGKLYNLLNAVINNTTDPNSSVVSAYFKPLKDQYLVAKSKSQVAAEPATGSDVAELLSGSA